MRDWERGENDMNWKDFLMGFLFGAISMFILMGAIGAYYGL